MVKLSFSQLYLITGLGISLFLFLSLRHIEERYKKAAKYIGLFILGYLALQVEVNVVPVLQREVSFIIPSLPILYFLPVFFVFFVMYSADSDFFADTTYRLLFIPGILDTVYSISTWIYASSIQQGAIYQFITGRTGFLFHQGAAILFSLVCLVVLIVFLKGVLFRDNETFRFFRYLIAFISVITVRWIILFLANMFELSWYNFRIEEYFYLVESAFLLYVGYKILIIPKLLDVRIEADKQNNQDDELEQAKEMQSIIAADKLFLNTNLNRRDLGKALGISEVKISQLLNDTMGTSFYELINTYRVEEAIHRIQSGHLDSITIQALAHEVGFKSKTTFNRSFKEMTGYTPSEYRTQHEK